MSGNLDIPKPIKQAIGGIIGLIVLAVLAFAFFSVTGILKSSSPNDQNINNSLTALENQGKAILGADGTYTCESCNDNFWTGFLVGVVALIILIAVVIGIVWLIHYLMEEYGDGYSGGL